MSSAQIIKEHFPPLGIIAAAGLLPLELAQIYSNKGGEVFIAALNDAIINKQITEDFTCKTFDLGQIGAVINYFNSNKVRYIVFAGHLKRPDLKRLKVDLVGSVLLTKILSHKLLGDDRLLNTIVTFFESRGFSIIAPHDILSMRSGEFFLPAPELDQQDLIDTQIGVQILHHLSSFDIGQAVIVHNGYVLGIEAAEGTDRLIERCASLRSNSKGGILVKIMKQNQDTRIDMPSIGCATIKLLINYGYKGIAIKKNTTIIIEPQKVFDFAAAHNLLIIDVDKTIDAFMYP